MSAIIHITREGERWDTLAYTDYGDPTAYERILAANPATPMHPVLPGGLVLQIPVVTAAQTSNQDLPPWKR